jgi:hypothetical protein
MRKLFGGNHRQAMNSPVTSAVELRAHGTAIAACFVFQRKKWPLRFLGLFRQHRPIPAIPQVASGDLSSSEKVLSCCSVWQLWKESACFLLRKP